MTKIFQIILTNEKTEAYIVLDTFESFEMAELMLKWYLAHNSFFNGTFSIRDASC